MAPWLEEVAELRSQGQEKAAFRKFLANFFLEGALVLLFFAAFTGLVVYGDDMAYWVEDHVSMWIIYGVTIFSFVLFIAAGLWFSTAPPTGIQEDQDAARSTGR